MAKQQQDWLQRRAAIGKELDMLSDLECFKEIPLEDVAIDPKTGRRYQIIPTKIDLKMKFDAMGLATKYKARLVALGDQEWKDTFGDVFSPKANAKTINLLLALVVHHRRTCVRQPPRRAFLPTTNPAFGS